MYTYNDVGMIKEIVKRFRGSKILTIEISSSHVTENVVYFRVRPV
jgi:hypothetical protein